MEDGRKRKEIGEIEREKRERKGNRKMKSYWGGEIKEKRERRKN